MHIGHKYRYQYHYTIQQNNSVCQLSDTAEERDLGIIVTVLIISVHRSNVRRFWV